MAITNRDELINAMANNNSRILIDKGSIASQAAGTFVSLWRAVGQPAQAAIPGAAARCTNSTTGAIQFTQQTAPATSYITILESLCGNSTATIEIHDRLMHMGGLSGTVTTAQTVGVDIDANLASDNIDARKGDSNYSDIMWWLEWYTATGSTAVNATVNVTFNDGTSNNLTNASLLATRPASFMLPLNSLVQPADAGKYIRDVNTVTLSATTGTAGSFGVTATRYRAGNFMPLANSRYTSDWAQLGLPEVHNSSCLFPIILTTTTSSGLLRATGKISHG
jgi:hypothetical protein